jgi:hypothetical protein
VPIVIAAPAPDRRSRSNTLLNVGLAVIGGALLVITVRRVGWTDVMSSVASIGWWFALVLVLGGARFAARARAWQVCAAGAGLRFRLAFAATLAGDALGNLTPLGLLASEPAKVFFVSDRVSTVNAASSVAAENAFYMASVLVMLAAGAWVFVRRAGLPPAMYSAAEVVLAAALVGAIAVLWIARRRPAILSRLAQAMARRTGRGLTAPERLREVEERFYGVLSWPAARLGRVLGCEALFHVAAVAEVFMVLRLLSEGQSVSLLDAFVLETAGRLVVVVFKFVPYRLGVDEAGAALVARALTLDPAVGVALALVRRVRILCWNLIGLFVLLRRR